jgi:alkanesulfonate monooxygenase SsuD/methylene tetrahydromethanopterin reductase-like flavin-dependent oxidoreductase (luciferase family)
VRLASTVTILPTADPVRAFEDFATVDLLSDGRAEVIAGCGVFTESFPLLRERHRVAILRRLTGMQKW